MAATTPVRVRSRIEPAPPPRAGSTRTGAVRVIAPAPPTCWFGLRRGAALLAALLVIGSLLVTVAANAYLTQGQILLARLQQQVAVQSKTHRDLELQVAQLESPSRLVSQAERQGLSAPTEVGDLAQVNLQLPLPLPGARSAGHPALQSVPTVTVVPVGAGR